MEQLLGSVFRVSGIIEESVRLRLITVTSTLIVPDITNITSVDPIIAFYFGIFNIHSKPANSEARSSR